MSRHHQDDIEPNHQDEMEQNQDEIEKNQHENTAKLVMKTFYKVVNKDGVTASDITKYLQEQFGDVWKQSILTGKAEETLKKSAALGILERFGDRYIANMIRKAGCGRRRRRRRRSCRRRRRSCRRRQRRRAKSRRRRSCRRSRRRRRRRSCCCGK